MDIRLKSHYRNYLASGGDDRHPISLEYLERWWVDQSFRGADNCDDVHSELYDAVYAHDEWRGGWNS